MFCTNCGKAIPPKAKFCPNCGYPVAIINPEEESKVASTGIENKHEWIDLGPSVKWAACNVGANTPGDYGSCFSWGETSTKAHYEWIDYRYIRVPKLFGSKKLPSNSDSLEEYSKKLEGLPRLISKYNSSDRKFRLESIDDAACINWGGRWRMPTISEFEELQSQCTWEWTIFGRKRGYKVTGKNGNSIFLPAAGNENRFAVGENGWYWTSELNNDVYLFPIYGKSIKFSQNNISMVGWERSSGISVRPVIE